MSRGIPYPDDKPINKSELPDFKFQEFVQDRG